MRGGMRQGWRRRARVGRRWRMRLIFRLAVAVMLSTPWTRLTTEQRYTTTDALSSILCSGVQVGGFSSTRSDFAEPTQDLCSGNDGCSQPGDAKCGLVAPELKQVRLILIMAGPRVTSRVRKTGIVPA